MHLVMVLFCEQKPLDFSYAGNGFNVFNLSLAYKREISRMVMYQSVFCL